MFGFDKYDWPLDGDAGLEVKALREELRQLREAVTQGGVHLLPHDVVEQLGFFADRMAALEKRMSDMEKRMTAFVTTAKFGDALQLGERVKRLEDRVYKLEKFVTGDFDG